ncbi:MAG: amino acid ABC transporter substrate-binding protein [Candidatus Cloacimonetes bacterium]|mgnify:CR=1 FL=1|nr:amino acid ABC transporter substrate-binding protein [Candidatus Cloacimonadota bacterium]HPM00993.1 transporter substrate-binding domain-containing protein [Candidatus Cloacimonadota bacterium]
MKGTRKIIFMMLMMTLFSMLWSQNKLTFICEEYPPYEYTQNKVPKGLDVEIIDRVCKEAKLDYEIQFYPWERCMQMIKEGRADAIFGILKNNERLAFLKYPDKSVSMDKRVLITKKNNPSVINKLEDLKGRTVGVVRGYAYSDVFDKSEIFKKDISASSESMIDKLKGDRFEFAAISEYVAKYYIGNESWSNFKVQPYIITSDPLYTAFSKKSENAMKLFDRYNNALNALEKSGELTKIRNRYR